MSSFFINLLEDIGRKSKMKWQVVLLGMMFLIPRVTTMMKKVYSPGCSASIFDFKIPIELTHRRIL